MGERPIDQSTGTRIDTPTPTNASCQDRKWEKHCREARRIDKRISLQTARLKPVSITISTSEPSQSPHAWSTHLLWPLRRLKRDTFNAIHENGVDYVSTSALFRPNADLIPDSSSIHSLILSPPRLTAARARPSGLPGEDINISFGSIALQSDAKELNRYLSPMTDISAHLK